jgi:hypothetical protein
LNVAKFQVKAECPEWRFLSLETSEMCASSAYSAAVLCVLRGYGFTAGVAERRITENAEKLEAWRLGIEKSRSSETCFTKLSTP